jgi:hypothetical protein
MSGLYYNSRTGGIMELQPTRILGNWKPKNIKDLEDLGKRFQKKLKKLGLKAPAVWRMTLRDPSFNRDVANGFDPLGVEFHKDDDDAQIMLLMWSNILPTEVISDKTGKPFQVKDGDILLLNNSAESHRAQPRAITETPIERWFIRIHGKHLEG